MPSIPLLSSLVNMFTRLPQAISDATRSVSNHFSKLVLGVRSSAKAAPGTTAELRSLAPMQVGAQVTQVRQLGSVRSHAGADSGRGLLYEMERRSQGRSAHMEPSADKQFAAYFSPYYAVPERENAEWIIVTAKNNRIMIDASYAALFSASAKRADKVIEATKEGPICLAEAAVLPREKLQLPTEKFVLPRAKLIRPSVPASIKSDFSQPRPGGKQVRFLDLETVHEQYRPRNVR